VFRDAYAIAKQFTFPVILSQKTVAGKCASGIGAFVVINGDGWIATAGHIIEQIQAAYGSAEKCRTRDPKAAAIRADASIDDRERRKRLRDLGQTTPDEVDRASVYWGGFQAQAASVHVVPGVDLGIARLQPFDPAWVSLYPTFKDPNQNFEPGVSLCKLGYPFHDFVPTYDAATDMFTLPPGAVPAPLFPLEGMFTRIAQITDPNNPNPAVPTAWVETSSPGLRGQSGGPTFDAKGTVWAIQCQTTHFDLGFNTTAARQYLNVGHGVHTLTLFAALQQLGVQYTVSNY
jgi:hypothetical protein